MKIIQISIIIALIASIVTEDKYVVAKLPPGALAKGAKGAKGDDYWARPWANPRSGATAPSQRTTTPDPSVYYQGFENMIPFGTIIRRGRK